MIFFVVDYLCYDVQGADKVLDALQRAAQYQIDQSITGVVTYHFSRPLIEYAERLRFIEFYSSETAFWEHSIEPSVSKELMLTFNPKIRKSFTWMVVYSEDVDKKVRDVVKTMGGVEITPIFSHSDLDIIEKSKFEPVFLVGHMSDKGDAIPILEKISTHFSQSTIYYFLFKSNSEGLYLIALWPNQDELINNLNRLTLPELNFSTIQIYHRPEVVSQQLIDAFEPWKPQFLIMPQAGYFLHPGYK